jgi:hypothetical protein
LELDLRQRSKLLLRKSRQDFMEVWFSQFFFVFEFACIVNQINLFCAILRICSVIFVNFRISFGVCRELKRGRRRVKHI